MKIDFEAGESGAVVAPPPVLDVAEAAPPLRFDLPRSLLLQMVGVTTAYMVVMGLAFRGGQGIGLVFAIFGIVFAGYYGLPLVMARASGAQRERQPRGAWGIDTASGYLPGRAAWVQVMTVPLLMLVWAIVVAIIH